MSTDQAAKTKELREGAQKLLAVDYFAALGVSRTATPDEVKRAFLETVKSWHPDRIPSGLDELRPLFGKVFARLELARATISDPARRARYIEDLAKPANASASDMSSAEATLEFRKAEGLLKKNDATQAEVHLRRAVQLAPQNAEYQVLLVWLQAKPDSTPARDPKAERAYLYRGQLRKRLDLQKEAFADFSHAAELNPNNVDAMREVRIYKMRQERGAPGGAAKKDAAARSADEGGVGGFFKKLFKR
jgi:curved DNA-binding protein CbpA